MKTLWRRRLHTMVRACALSALALLVCPSAFSVTVGAQSPIAPGAPQGSAAGDATARQEPPPSIWQVAPAWSPDGSRYVTVSMRGGQVDLWVTQADTGAATRWTDDNAVEGQPAWSPNGRCIAYVTTRNTPGIDVKCDDAPAWRLISDARRPQWSPDGKRILCMASRDGRIELLTVPAENGANGIPVLPWLSSELMFAADASWRPDGVHLAIVGLDRNHALGLWVLALDARAPLGKPALNLGVALKDIGYQFYSPILSRSGDAFYAGTASKGEAYVWRLPLNPKTQAAAGRPQQVAQAAADSVSFDLAPNGDRLAVAWETASTRIWLFPFNAETGAIGVDQGQSVGPQHGVAASPDLTLAGDRLAYTSLSPETGRQELHVRQADGADRALAADKDQRYGPRWSPDGSTLAYRWQAADGTRFMVRLMDVQTGAERDITSSFPTSEYTPFWWTADGQAVLASLEYKAADGVNAYAIAQLPLQSSDHKAKVIAANNKFQLWQSSVSRDGRWIVFVAQPLDNTWSSLMVMPAGGGQWKSITDQLGWDDKPRWSPDGRTIYFLSRRSGEFEVWALPFNPQAGAAAGAPRQLTHLSDAQRHIFRGTGWLEFAISSTQLAVPIEDLASRVSVVAIPSGHPAKE